MREDTFSLAAAHMIFNVFLTSDLGLRCSGLSVPILDGGNMDHIYIDGGNMDHRSGFRGGFGVFN